MKVGFLIGNMSHTGGTERVLQCIANGLVKRGHQIIVISMWGEKYPVFPLDKRIKRYRLGEKYPEGPLKHMKNVISLYQIVKKEQISILVDVDLILTFYSLPVRVLIPGLKRISWEHFNYYHPFDKHHIMRKLARRLSVRFSDVVLVLSKEDLRCFQKYCYRKHFRNPAKICRIYNPNPYENAVCERISQKMVLAAGRLTKVKGFDSLLSSWELLEADFKEWRLCIAGEGEERENLLAIIREKGLKSVELLGHVKDMESLYNKCAFFVLPSRYEGFGMVLAEAMAHKRAVVSYDCKSGPGEIITDGKDGFLVRCGDYQSFAAKMRCLMESEQLRKNMGENAKESSKRFDSSRILLQWEKLLHMSG